MKLLSLFSGIGCFDLAASWLGLETAQMVEIDPFCQKVLRKNFPEIPIHDDIKTYSAKPKSFDIIIGGFPCQDLSRCGAQSGVQGDRSILFYELTRLICEVQPLGFAMENVIGVFDFAEVFDEIASLRDYIPFWFTLSVAQLGGCHIRDRWFCVAVLADSQGKRYPRARSSYLEARANKTFSSCSQPEREKGISRLCRKDDGITPWLDQCRLMSKEEAWELIKQGESCDTKHIPHRGKRIKSLGNAVTPQQYYVALCALLELMKVASHEFTLRN